MPFSDPEYLRRETWSLIEAAYLLAGEEPQGGEPIPLSGRAAHFYANLKDATDHGSLRYAKSRTPNIKNRRVRPWDAVQWAVARGDDIRAELRSIPEPKLATEQADEPRVAAATQPITATEAHVSDKLATLNQAARKFWANAQRDKRDTQPDNQTVVAWLVKKGFSETLADKGATIIRPEWAGTGRKPEK